MVPSWCLLRRQTISSTSRDLLPRPGRHRRRIGEFTRSSCELGYSGCGRGIGFGRCQESAPRGGSVYDPNDAVGGLLFNVLAMVAEFTESDLIRLCTREEMKVAKAKRRLRGKQPKLNPVYRAQQRHRAATRAGEPRALPAEPTHEGRPRSSASTSPCAPQPIGLLGRRPWVAGCVSYLGSAAGQEGQRRPTGTTGDSARCSAKPDQGRTRGRQEPCRRTRRPLDRGAQVGLITMPQHHRGSNRHDRCPKTNRKVTFDTSWRRWLSSSPQPGWLHRDWAVPQRLRQRPLGQGRRRAPRWWS